MSNYNVIGTSDINAVIFIDEDIFKKMSRNGDLHKMFGYINGAIDSLSRADIDYPDITPDMFQRLTDANGPYYTYQGPVAKVTLNDIAEVTGDYYSGMPANSDWRESVPDEYPEVDFDFDDFDELGQVVQEALEPIYEKYDVASMVDDISIDTDPQYELEEADYERW